MRAEESAVVVRVVEYAENVAIRTATYEPAGAGWPLSGEDAQRFVRDDGVLRFAHTVTGAVFLPNFEAPADVDGDNRYQVRLATADASAIEVEVYITDRDEPGWVTLSTA